MVQVMASCSTAKFYYLPFVWTAICPIPPLKGQYAIVKTINKKRKQDPDEGQKVRINENPNHQYEGKEVGMVEGHFKKNQVYNPARRCTG